MKKMNLLLLILFCVGFGTVTLTTFSTAYGAFQPSENYVIEAQGFSISEKTIENSFFDMSFLTTTSGEKINVQVTGASIFFQGKDFVFSKFDVSILRDGKFLRLVGVSEDPQGNELTLRLFGRLMGTSSDATVYEFKGKLDHNNERYNSHFVGKTQTEMKIPQVSSEILDSEEKPEPIDIEPIVTEPTITEPIITEPIITEPEPTPFKFLVKQPHSTWWRQEYKFNAKAFELDANPLNQFDYFEGLVPGVHFRVDIAREDGTHLVTLEDNADDKGYYLAKYFIVENLIKPGKYLVNVAASKNGFITTQNFTTFVIGQVPSGSTSNNPIANAGPDQPNVMHPALVTLDGSASQDPKGRPLTYLWTTDGDPSCGALIPSNMVESPTFNTGGFGVCTLSLVVNNGVSDSNTDTVTITIT